MPRLLMVSIFVLLLGLLLVVGCKENLDQSELDQFLAWTEGMEYQARQDTLDALAESGTQRGAYASYVLGNFHYQAATDSAYARGWNDPSVAALLDSAESCFNSAVAVDSNFVEALVNLGSIYDDRSQQLAVREVRDGRYKMAEKYYRLALASSPYDEKARCNLGSLYLRQKRVDMALDEYQAVLDHDPASPLAHYNMAIMFAESKIYKEAIHEWELAAENDPDGDIGQRSRDNIKIVNDLLNAPDPASLR